jgi:uncharacterized protein (DUF488 family)
VLRANSLSTLHTIGHSTRTFDELVAALKAHGVGTLVDIRAFPTSRRMPHFNRESLEVELPARGIRYVWMRELGGHRKKILDDSPNTGLRNDSFRNYADYMLTPEFESAIKKLLMIAAETAGPSATAGNVGPPPVGMTSPKGVDPADNVDPTLSPKEGEKDGSPVDAKDDLLAGNTAYMCAERVYFQCHRMLVSDYLTAHGHAVLHIDDEKRAPRLHKLMPEAHLVDGKLLYNAQQLF